MPAKPIRQAKDGTLTLRLPQKLKDQAEKEAERKKFRSTGDYVTALIAQDVATKKAA